MNTNTHIYEHTQTQTFTHSNSTHKIKNMQTLTHAHAHTQLQVTQHLYDASKHRQHIFLSFPSQKYTLSSFVHPYLPSFNYSDDAPKKENVDDGAEKAKALEESKRKKVNLIDAKRGQNAGIALARIKVGFTEVRERYATINFCACKNTYLVPEDRDADADKWRMSLVSQEDILYSY